MIPHALLHAGDRRRRPEQSEPRILFFGLIRPDKGLDLLIEALPVVCSGARGDARVVGSPRMPIEPLRSGRGARRRRPDHWDPRFVRSPRWRA